jgi:hypothetical protein
MRVSPHLHFACYPRKPSFVEDSRPMGTGLNAFRFVRANERAPADRAVADRAQRIEIPQFSD